MGYLLEYSEKHGFYITKNRTNQNRKGRKTLSEDIGYDSAKRFSASIRQTFPGMWKGIYPAIDYVVRKFTQFETNNAN